MGVARTGPGGRLTPADVAGPPAALQSYLDYRQLRRTAEKAVPPKLEGIVDEERFLKAQGRPRRRSSSTSGGRR